MNITFFCCCLFNLCRQFLKLFFHLHKWLKNRQKLLINSPFKVSAGVLFHISYFSIFANGHRTAVRGNRPCQHTEQCGFSCSVSTDKAYFVPFLHIKGNGRKKLLFYKCNSQIKCRQYRHKALLLL